MSQTPNSFASASLVIADFLDTLDLSLKQVRLLGFLRLHSFGKGRMDFDMPSMDLFGQAIGCSKGNASQELGRLEDARAIERGAGLLAFRFPLSAWKIAPRARELRVWEQLGLNLPPANLAEALREQFVEQCQHDGSRVPSTMRVPDLGTRPISLAGDRTHAKPYASSSCALAVPESGTHMQQCNIVLSKEQNCIVKTSPAPFPESEPESRDNSTRAFDSERQRVFDQLRDLGAFGTENQARGCWFGMVQKRLDVTKELIGDLKDARRRRIIPNPGGWMMDRWKRWGRPDE